MRYAPPRSLRPVPAFTLQRGDVLNLWPDSFGPYTVTSIFRVPDSTVYVIELQDFPAPLVLGADEVVYLVYGPRAHTVHCVQCRNQLTVTYDAAVTARPTVPQCWWCHL